MGSAFKDGVDAGLSDFKSYNSDLGNVSLSTDPDGFSNVVSIAGRACDVISRMRSGFERIGENLHDDPKSWAERQRQRLLDGCSALLTQAQNLTTGANEALNAANQAKDLRDATDSDDDKKSQLDEAEQHLKEASDTLRERIDDHRAAVNAFYDLIRDVNTEFKNAIALAKNGVDGNQSQVDQVLNDIRNLEDQFSGKFADLQTLSDQYENAFRSHKSLCGQVGDKDRAEKEADSALIEGAKKDPPLSASDLQSLAQTCATARQDTKSTEADRDNYELQTLVPVFDAYRAKLKELSPALQQLSGLKQQRDTLIDGLNRARTALTELNLEYQEPSL